MSADKSFPAVISIRTPLPPQTDTNKKTQKLKDTDCISSSFDDEYPPHSLSTEIPFSQFTVRVDLTLPDSKRLKWKQATSVKTAVLKS